MVDSCRGSLKQISHLTGGHVSSCCHFSLKDDKPALIIARSSGVLEFWSTQNYYDMDRDQNGHDDLNQFSVNRELKEDKNPNDFSSLNSDSTLNKMKCLAKVAFRDKADGICNMYCPKTIHDPNNSCFEKIEQNYFFLTTCQKVGLLNLAVLTIYKSNNLGSCGNDCSAIFENICHKNINDDITCSNTELLVEKGGQSKWIIDGPPKQLYTSSSSCNFKNCTDTAAIVPLVNSGCILAKVNLNVSALVLELHKVDQFPLPYAPSEENESHITGININIKSICPLMDVTDSLGRPLVCALLTQSFKSDTIYPSIDHVDIKTSGQVDMDVGTLVCCVLDYHEDCKGNCNSYKFTPGPWSVQNIHAGTSLLPYQSMNDNHIIGSVVCIGLDGIQIYSHDGMVANCKFNCFPTEYDGHQWDDVYACVDPSAECGFLVCLEGKIFSESGSKISSQRLFRVRLSQKPHPKIISSVHPERDNLPSFDIVPFIKVPDLFSDNSTIIGKFAPQSFSCTSSNIFIIGNLLGTWESSNNSDIVYANFIYLSDRPFSQLSLHEVLILPIENQPILQEIECSQTDRYSFPTTESKEQRKGVGNNSIYVVFAAADLTLSTTKCFAKSSQLQHLYSVNIGLPAIPDFLYTPLVICISSNSCLLIFSSFDATIVMSVSMTDDEQPYDDKDYGNEPIVPGSLLHLTALDNPICIGIDTSISTLAACSMFRTSCNQPLLVIQVTKDWIGCTNSKYFAKNKGQDIFFIKAKFYPDDNTNFNDIESQYKLLNQNNDFHQNCLLCVLACSNNYVEIVEITKRDGDPTCLFNILTSIKVPSEISGICIGSVKNSTNNDSPLQSFDNYSCVVGVATFNSPSVLMYKFNRVATVFNKIWSRKIDLSYDLSPSRFRQYVSSMILTSNDVLIVTRSDGYVLVTSFCQQNNLISKLKCYRVGRTLPNLSRSCDRPHCDHSITFLASCAEDDSIQSHLSAVLVTLHNQTVEFIPVMPSSDTQCPINSCIVGLSIGFVCWMSYLDNSFNLAKLSKPFTTRNIPNMNFCLKNEHQFHNSVVLHLSISRVYLPKRSVINHEIDVVVAVIENEEGTIITIFDQSKNDLLWMSHRIPSECFIQSRK